MHDRSASSIKPAPIAIRWAKILILQSGLTLAALVVLLELWHTDLRVPFGYWGDTLLQLAVTKSIADGGWIWFIDHLGAPFGMPMAAFPQNLTTTSVVLKVLSIFTHEPGLLLNVYWLLTVVLASVNAHLALTVLGYRSQSALVLATLYALLPYAFYRNIEHLPLVYPFIPVLAAFAVQIAANTAASLSGRWGKYVVLCAVLQGFEYPYYAFFSAFIFVFAGLLTYFYHRSGVQARRVSIVCAFLIVSSAINLAPTFVEWNKHGKPPNTSYKIPAEAEAFGLKLRQLLSPVQPSRSETLREFGQSELQFPNENENATTRLGTILSVGLLAMLAHCLFRRQMTAQVRAAAALTLGSFLLATVGGLGAIFNLIVTPDIRAYNRIVVFIAFFVIVYLAEVIDDCHNRLISGSNSSTMHRRNVMAAIVLAALLVFGIFDQGQAAQVLVARRANDTMNFYQERALVAEIERRHPDGGAVMQLPETTFPPDGGRGKMFTYDHARPYLSSTRLSWSWPSFSQRREGWYDALGSVTEGAFLNRLVMSDFIGVWVDRLGYESAELKMLERQLTSSLGPPLIGGQHDRYAYFDLARVRPPPDSPVLQSEHYVGEKNRLLNPLLLTFQRGFYEQEQNGERRHRWSRRDSALRVRNGGGNSRTGIFSATVQAGQAGVLVATVAGEATEKIAFSASESKPISIAVTVPPGAFAEVSFEFEGERLIAPGDSRTLYFAVINPRLEER